MSNRMGFLCYLGSILDLSAKPQQYVWLYGLGSEGKSSISDMLKRLFGSISIATDWPKEVDKFFSSRLEGRRLLLVDEEPNGKCVESALWRKLTGSKTLICEPKHKQAYEIDNKLLIIVGSNFRPATKAKKADLRRLVICEVQTISGPEIADYDEILFKESVPLMSVCSKLWLHHKGKNNQVPVDYRLTLENLDEICAHISEFINEHFEVFNAGKIQMALANTAAKKEIPHTSLSELGSICDRLKVEFW